MKKCISFCLLVFSTFVLGVGFAASGDISSDIKGVRMWPAPDNTRLVFDLDHAVNYKIFRLSNPERLVLDIKSAKLRKSLAQPSKSDVIIKKIRSATRNHKDVRVVLDLKSKTQYKSFLLQPNSEYGHRLVVDLTQAGGVAVKKVKKTVKTAPIQRDFVIAIDAGHGGDDPGASGYKGTSEKDVVLAIARKLEKLIKKEPGMRPVMIRTGDYFLSLRQRTKKAREYKADLFISIHADAFHDKRVKGSSIYVLSQNGVSSEAARILAEKENASDLIGGVSLDDKDDMLATVLLDLSQTATIEASYDLANAMLKKLKNVSKLHKRDVQQAGFVVLKSPDMPSILIETAFISNPGEERKLRSPRHQESMAKAMLSGIRNYYASYAMSGLNFAANTR